MSEEFKSEFGHRVKELRELHGSSLGEVAEEAGINRAILDEIERGEREPNISAVMTISDALDTNISQITNPEYFRIPEKELLIENPDILDEVPINSSNIFAGIKNTYRNLDIMNLALQRDGLDPLAKQFDELQPLSTIIGEFFSSGVAEVSDGLYEVNTGNFPDLISTGKQSGVPGIEIKVAVERNMPKGHKSKTGMYTSIRYVLAERDKTYERGERKDTAWIWEVRMGRMSETEQFNKSDTEGDSGKTATIESDALWEFDCVYLDPELIPYVYYEKKDKEALYAVQGQETF